MFITTADAESLDLVDSMRPGERMWRGFRQELNWPWFHVSIANGSESATLLTSELSDWLTIPSHNPDCSDGDTTYLVQTRLVSPGWLNGSGGWKMEVLREIWRGLEAAYDVPVLVFVPEGGGRYVDSELRTEAAMLRGLRRIFPIDVARA